MTRDLDCWLQEATRGLSNDSAAQVRTEIQEHYHSAREAAMSGGATEDEANRIVLTALGDPKIVNKQYLGVLRCDDLLNAAPETRAGYHMPGRVISIIMQGTWE